MSETEIPDDDAWSAWRPEELGRRLRGVEKPWCIVGGWALDLWHGRESASATTASGSLVRKWWRSRPTDCPI